jgi:hypothetical protein
MRLYTILIALIIIIIPILIYINSVPSVELYENEKLCDYILIEIQRQSDTDFGGIYWWMHQIACAFKLAKHNHKKVLVHFTRGAYADPDRPEPSWWHYYFDLPSPITEHQMELITHAKKYKKLDVISTWDLKPTDNMHLYQIASTFSGLMRTKMTDTCHVYRDFLKLNEETLDHFNQFCFENNVDFNKPFVGIHYRGTDKWFCHGQNEDLTKNEHMRYEDVAQHINNILSEIKTKESQPIHLYVCSDEQPFVDYIFENFPNVVTYDAFRSPVNTSGIELSDNMDVTEKDDTQDGQNLAYFVSTAIHRGFDHIPPYKKGLDAVMDVLCLSKCKYYIRCQNGNFSSQPLKWNPNIIEYNLSDEL